MFKYVKGTSKLALWRFQLHRFQQYLALSVFLRAGATPGQRRSLPILHSIRASMNLQAKKNILFKDGYKLCTYMKRLSPTGFTKEVSNLFINYLDE